MSEPLRTVNVGLIGLGTVGGGVARLIKSPHDEYPRLRACLGAGRGSRH